MAWKKKQVTLLVARDKVQFVGADVGGPLLFPFAAPVIHNLELLDQIGFEKAFQQFLDKEKFFQMDCTIILDESFLFWKRVPLDAPESNFFDLIPLPADQQTRKQVQIDTYSILSGYNSSILTSIQRSLNAKKNSVSTILPFFAFPAFETTAVNPMSIDMTSVRKYCKFDSDILKFSTTRQVAPLPVILVSVAALILLTGGAWYFIVFSKQQTVKPLVKKIVVVPSPTPTIAYMSPKDVKIDIKNGSGRVGEAGKLKATLEKADYTIANVGNSDVDVKNTEIATKLTVPRDFIASLSATLGTQYIVSSSSAMIPVSTNSADIVITIGIDKKASQ